MHLLVKSPATPKACSESARLAGGAEPQLLAALAGPPDHPGHRHGLERWPRANSQPRAGLPRPASSSSGSWRSHREHEDLDGGEKVLDLERRGRESICQEPMSLGSVTIIDNSVMSDTVQPAYRRANAARREYSYAGGRRKKCGRGEKRTRGSIRQASRTAKCGSAEGAHHYREREREREWDTSSRPAKSRHWTISLRHLWIFRERIPQV